VIQIGRRLESIAPVFDRLELRDRPLRAMANVDHTMG
jgi:hypothetical protein